MNCSRMNQLHRFRSRILPMVGGGFVLLLVVVTLVIVTQLSEIREYLSQANGEPANLVVDTTAVLGNTPRPWRYLAQGGESHNWRLQSLIPPVKALQPQYIRIDHIYDFYDVVGGTPGNLTFNFSKLDGLLDDIKATGAKPYIVLSYMPPAISSGDIVAPPKRWEDWQLTVQKTVEHISGSRKTSEVYYEVWNEPDLFGGWKYSGERNYLTMYRYAVQGAENARGVLPFKIGGPATTGLYKNWFNALAQFTIDNNLRFDFFSWHRYNTKIDEYRTDMIDVRTWLREFPQLEPTLELHITEWGHDSDLNAGYDGAYSAAHTVAVAIEMMGVVEKAFVFEIQDGKSPEGKAAWGRWGLFQHQDFGQPAKSRYYGLRMLDRIGDQRIQLLGKGSWVKAVAALSPEGNPQVVIANFDPQGRHSETVPITFIHLEPGVYRVNQEFLGGRKLTQEITIESDILKTDAALSVNTVAFIEVVRKE